MTPKNWGPKGSAQGTVAMGMDSKVKEAQEGNRVSYQSQAGDKDGKIQ